MSSKGTIFFTKDNEHCYNETLEKDGDAFRVYLQISSENIKYLDVDETEGILIGIKGDSELAERLSNTRYKK